MMLSAREIIWRIAASGSGTPLMPTIASRRDSASRGVLAWMVVIEPVVAGVHGLEHVEHLGAADLADDDPVGPHAERVPDEVARE